MTLKALLNNKFYTNSLIFLLASLLVNFGNYIFHFLMARGLKPAAYGEFQTLLALSAILGVLMSVLTTVVVKYTATLKASGETAKIRYLFLNLTKKFLLLGGLLVILFILTNHWLVDFLQLTSGWSLIIIAIGLLISFLSSITTGLLQGFEKFKQLAAVNFLSVVVKILLGVVLIKLSWQVSGALGAVVLSGVAGYALTFLFLKFLFQEKSQTAFDFAALKKYSVPVFLTLFLTTLFYNLDLVLVKHFFIPAVAGQYAALALLGHVVFFVASPLAAVMFPMTSAAHEQKISPVSTFKKSLAITLLIGLVFLLVYFCLANLMIKVLVGVQFLVISPYLGWFGLAMFFYSLIFLFTQYFLSINKIKFIYWLLVGVFLQVVLISVWHQNLGQVVVVMNLIMLVNLSFLLIYYKKVISNP